MVESIHKTLYKFLDNLKKDQIKQKIYTILDRELDSKTKSHVKGYNLRGKKLFIYVDSPLWIFQLNLLKPHLLNIFLKRNLNSVVEEIKIRLSRR